MNIASRATQGRVHSVSDVYSQKPKAKTSHHVFVIPATDLPVYGSIPTSVHFYHKQCCLVADIPSLSDIKGNRARKLNQGNFFMMSITTLHLSTLCAPCLEEL